MLIHATAGGLGILAAQGRQGGPVVGVVGTAAQARTDIVVAGVGSDLYALDPVTGAQRRRYPVDGSVVGGPAVDGDLVYFGVDKNKHSEGAVRAIRL